MTGPGDTSGTLDVSLAGWAFKGSAILMSLAAVVVALLILAR